MIIASSMFTSVTMPLQKPWSQIAAATARKINNSRRNIIRGSGFGVQGSGGGQGSRKENGDVGRPVDVRVCVPGRSTFARTPGSGHDRTRTTRFGYNASAGQCRGGGRFQDFRRALG